MKQNSNNVILNEHQKNITCILLNTLLNEPGLSLSYEQIAEMSGIGKAGAISIGKSIGKISELCNQLGLPLLSVKVYSKGKGRPEDGFYNLFKRITGNPMNLSETEAVNEEFKKVLNCEHWQILSDYLDLGIDMTSFRNDEPIYPDDIYMRSSKIFEGIKQTVNVNKYERDSSARHICIEHKGSTCAICGFDFGKVYGQSFQGKIHVHHIVPISKIREKYELDPINDLIPVCPNCHLILHSKGKNDAYTPEQVKQFLEINSRAMSQTT